MTGLEIVGIGTGLAICVGLGLLLDRYVGQSRIGRRFSSDLEWRGAGRGRYLWFKTDDPWTDLGYQLAMVALLLLIGVVAVFVALFLVSSEAEGATPVTSGHVHAQPGGQPTLMESRPITEAVGGDRHVRFGSRPQAEPAVVVNHETLPAFNDLTPVEIEAASELRVLFIDHSVGENINQGLNCYSSESVASAPAFCRRFDHVTPELSAQRDWFEFGTQYDRGNWVYVAGGGSYWREWPDYVDGLLGENGNWDVVIMMPSYLVAPNGGWQPFEELESKYPAIVFVHATSSLPRGVAEGTERDLKMQEFNDDARGYALAHDKHILDVADILSHDYAGGACFDTRDGRQYCTSSGNCENLPDDGHDIPAICQHYTSELHGGHLGSVSGGMLRMAQSMWLLMARLGDYTGPPTTPSPSVTPGPTVTATLTPATALPTTTLFLPATFRLASTARGL